MKFVAAILFPALIGVLAADVCQADILEPANCRVQPADALDGIVVAPLSPVPLPSTINTINVRTAANAPVPNAWVTVELSPGVALCSGTMLGGVTNASGDVVLTLGGGGCIDGVAHSGVFKANGIVFRDYSNVKSPDYDGAAGDLGVDLSDLVVFSNEFLGSAAANCHDYDNNGVTNLSDLVIFSPAFVSPNNCN